jgi:hypothetical protein
MSYSACQIGPTVFGSWSKILDMQPHETARDTFPPACCFKLWDLYGPPRRLISCMCRHRIAAGAEDRQTVAWPGATDGWTDVRRTHLTLFIGCWVFLYFFGHRQSWTHLTRLSTAFAFSVARRRLFVAGDAARLPASRTRADSSSCIPCTQTTEIRSFV